MAIRRKRIQELVDTLLRENGVHQPPVPIERLAKARGISLSPQRFEGDEISGFLFRDKARTVIGYNTGHSPNRKRFTIAHELGHFFLHQGGVNPLHVDRTFAVKILKMRDGRSSEGKDVEEIEANAFAAAILMPESFVRADLESEDSLDMEEDEELIKKLAKRYGVSKQALLFRLSNLGYTIL